MKEDENNRVCSDGACVKRVHNRPMDIGVDNGVSHTMVVEECDICGSTRILGVVGVSRSKIVLE